MGYTLCEQFVERNFINGFVPIHIWHGKHYGSFNVAEEQEMGGFKSAGFFCDNEIFDRPVKNDVIYCMRIHNIIICTRSCH